MKRMFRDRAQTARERAAAPFITLERPPHLPGGRNECLMCGAHSFTSECTTCGSCSLKRIR